MSYDSRFADTILSIYDAAVDIDAWPAAIGRIAGHVGGEGGCFVGFSWNGDTVSVFRTLGGDAGSDRTYQQKWARNPWADRSIRQPVGTAFATDALIDLPMLERTEYYQNFLRPLEIAHGLSTALAGSPDFLAGLAITRSRRAGAYDQAAIETFRALVPHLQRAAQIQLRLAGWEPRATLALALLDRLSVGVVLIGGRGDVLFANEAARRIADRHDGLVLGRGRLSAAAAKDRDRLQRLVADALRLGRGETGVGGGGMTVASAGGGLPLRLLVTPLVGTAADALACRGAAVFIRDPERDGAPDGDLLRQVFDLTPAEARIAALVAAGSGVAEAARATGTGPNTVKTHLARVFTKTGTRRQSELAALLGDLPGVLADQPRA